VRAGESGLVRKPANVTFEQAVVVPMAGLTALPGLRAGGLRSGQREDLLHLAKLLEDGTVTPYIERSYPLKETADPLAYVGAGHARGKVVITV
jgi:NADPH:quinone reductase-like Zn-dependent oxidoreductase